MRHFNAWILLITGTLAVFVGAFFFQTRVLEPRRRRMLGLRSELPRALVHAADYGSARAAGQRPQFVPGGRGVGLSDLPNRAAALSLGGLRGFLAMYLWIEAESSKGHRVHEDLLDKYHRIANLQPDYTSVWNFHAWNLAWNLSVQWSNVERRYQWIRYGIKFLQEGIRRNPESVDLLATMGYIYKQRIADNTRVEDREYFSAQVEKDEGNRPLAIAYKWYKQARLVQDETGNVHATYSKKILHQRSCYAAHEYAKELTSKALDKLAEAAELQTDGRHDDALRRLEDGRDALAFARRWWTTTVEEWGRQQAQFSDYNAGLFGNGARIARQEVDKLLHHLGPDLLRRDTGSFKVRVNSAQGHRLLVAMMRYDQDPPEAFHGP